MQFSNFLIKDIEIIKKLAPNSLNFEHDGNYIYLFSYIFATKIAFFADLYFIFWFNEGYYEWNVPFYTGEKLKKWIDYALDFSVKNKVKFWILLTHEQMTSINDSRFVAVEDCYDYLYLTSDLAAYVGKKFQDKRNLVNYFVNNYQYEFLTYNAYNEKLYSKTMEFLSIYNNERKHTLLYDDTNAIDWLLKHPNDLKNVFIYIIRIGQNVCALSVVSVYNGIVDSIFEHVDISYKGITPMLIKLICQNQIKQKYYNRQDDLGLVGLKKSKLSFNPVLRVKKYVYHN